MVIPHLYNFQLLFYRFVLISQHTPILFMLLTYNLLIVILYYTQDPNLSIQPCLNFLSFSFCSLYAFSYMEIESSVKPMIVFRCVLNKDPCKAFVM